MALARTHLICSWLTQVRSNFRGLRACLLLPGDSNLQVLEAGI
ncbi:hypothetical protein SAMN05421641_102204 [Paracoccus thiocyanatus]|uniref:Uncharacterized protein n=1 Tax=Paracoccus thiocyanatus TaxID=34006 RepID=A0A1N6P1R2_9RHOB|nr:hypothetical protein SAMN05421641_102204 [Paracoccus thiocyanatus]